MQSGTIKDRISEYLDEAEAVVRAISRSEVRVVVDRLFEGWQSRRTTYIIGNGGSASTASHMMNDLNKMTTREGLHRFRAIALTDNMPLVTAIGNDIEYADVFVEQLKNLLLPTDMLIAISGSGNSENIIRACDYARELGAFVIGLCGHPGSRLCTSANAVVTIPAQSICQQEDGHLILNHAIALALRDRIAAVKMTA
jgi:D-sedoheptulose 7-phosphate isomerase